MKKSTFSYICLLLSYMFFYMNLGAFVPYMNIYYERIGFSGNQIGLILSLGYLVAMFFAPLWGRIADKTKGYKPLISILLILQCISFIFWHRESAFGLVLFYSLLINVFKSNIGNLYDAFAIQYCKENNKEFSFIRSMGSIGFLLGSFVIGNFLFKHFNVQGPYIMVVLIACLCAILSINVVIQPKSFASGDEIKNSIWTLFKNKDYLFLLAFCFFSVINMDCSFSFIGNHLVSTLHFSDSSIGLINGAMVFPEIIIMMNIHRFFKKYGMKKVFIVACITQMLRTFVYAFSSSLPLILGISVVHGLMVCVGSVGVIMIIHKKIPHDLLATATTVYGGFVSVSYAIHSQIQGFVYQNYGSAMIYYLACFLTFIALLMVLKTKRLDD